MTRAFLALALLAASAHAHQAPSGWAYPQTCCGGDPTGQVPHGDCYPVPDATVREVRGGYVVTLRPGDHPFAHQTITAEIPHGDDRLMPSGDDRKHVCIVGGRVRCLFIPPGGV